MPHNGCAHCGSFDTEAEVDRYFCFSCGGHTDFHRNQLPRDPKFTVPQRGKTVQHG